MENERSIRRLMDEEAKDYINRHKILELFKNMTALLLYYQPGNVTWFQQNCSQEISDLLIYGGY